MPINREPESLDDHAPEESAVRRAPVDQDDAYELADHEYTLVADADDSRGWPYDEHTAPWSTLPPLPAWATKARALLEPPTLPRVLNEEAALSRSLGEETPTLVEEGDHGSATALRALRAELGQMLRDADTRAEQIEQLERSLASAVQARAEAELRTGTQAAELQGRVQGQGLRIADLEEEVRDLKAAREAREARYESQLRELNAARDASEGELQDDVRQLRAARDAREAELEEEVRELKAVHEVRAAALEELRAENADLEKRIAELETERKTLKSTKKARAAELEQLRASDVLKTTRVTELEAVVRELKAAREASTAELEQLRESYAAKATQVIELEHKLRTPANAREARDAELEQLRASDTANAVRVAALEDELGELKASRTARVEALESEVRELKIARDTQVAELESEVRELRTVRDAQVAQLEQLRATETARDERTTELEQLRADHAARAARFAELEHELRELRAFRDAHEGLDAASGFPSDSEVDIETTVEWITNAPPGLEVTIEVDANDDADMVVSAPASEAAATAHAAETEHLDAAALDSEVAAGLETDDTPRLASTPMDPDSIGETATLVSGGELASAFESHPETLVARETVDGDFAAESLPSPETTIEIDPDSDLFELDAAMPPLPAQTAADGSKRKRRPATKARKSTTKRSSAAHDDLQRIDGIGKTLEQRLYAKGIRTYAQLAALRPADVARVAKQIGVTPDRIARESWIAQARRLKTRAPKAPTTAAPKTRKRKRATA